MEPSTDTAPVDVLTPLRAIVPPDSEVAHSEAAREVVVRHLDEFHADDQTTVDNTLLGNRYLCRGGTLLIPGPTGVGKSSFTYQLGIQSALGKPFFGIRPSRALRVLVIQAENDDGDIAEIRDGIFRGLNLTPEDQAQACRQVQIVCETIATGWDFIALVERLVAKHKPDLLIIDPLFAYCGCDVSDQGSMSVFLRNGLNPVLQDHRCGLILVHHSNKPLSGRAKPDWKAGDFAYLGSGTAELANWARAVMVIRSIGSHKVFEVILAKRGKRAGLVDDEGEPLYSFRTKHSSAIICWEPATDDDDIAPGKKPRPGIEDIHDLIPEMGTITQAKLRNAASLIGVGQNRLRDILDELVDDKRVLVHETPRSGTRPAISYSRSQERHE